MTVLLWKNSERKHTISKCSMCIVHVQALMIQRITTSNYNEFVTVASSKKSILAEMNSSKFD